MHLPPIYGYKKKVDVSKNTEVTYDFIYIKYPKKESKFMGKKCEWLPGVEKMRIRKQLLNGYRLFFWGDENILEVDRGSDSTTPLGS